MVTKSRTLSVPTGSYTTSVDYPTCSGTPSSSTVATSPAVTEISTMQSVDNALWMLQKRLERDHSVYIKRGNYAEARSVLKELNRLRRKKIDNGNGAFQLEKFGVTDITARNVTAKSRKGLCPVTTVAANGMTVIPFINNLSALQTAVGVTLLTHSDMRAIAKAAAVEAAADGIPFQSRAELGTAVLETFGSTYFKGVPKVDVELPSIVGKQLREAFVKKVPLHVKIDKILNAAGAEYLNVVFGWLPTLGDVKDALVAVGDSAKLITDFNERYGRNYRFRKTLKDEVQTVSREINGTQFPYVAALQSNASKIQLSGTVRTKIWASGCYTILPVTDEQRSNSLFQQWRQADYLLGLQPDPEMLWEATPFSWLVDWQSNIGDVMKNASYVGLDGLVFRYAYAMMSMEIDVLATCGTFAGRQVQARFTGSRKVRVAGNPYGFAITPESFTSKQWSILAALGLTKAFGKL